MNNPNIYLPEGEKLESQKKIVIKEVDESYIPFSGNSPFSAPILNYSRQPKANPPRDASDDHMPYVDTNIDERCTTEEVLKVKSVPPGEDEVLKAIVERYLKS